MRDAILFVVTGPSGSGKGTIMRAIVESYPDIVKVATFTTRQPRSSEEHGFDYQYVSVEEFLAKVANGEISEYEQVYNDHYYGSPSFNPDKGPDRLMELDYKGMFKYEKVTKRLVSIFIAPPSLCEMVERITRRSNESNLKNRINNALEQLNFADHYDYVIINENMDDACKEAVAIVCAERTKRDKPARIRQVQRMCNEKG